MEFLSQRVSDVAHKSKSPSQKVSPAPLPERIDRARREARLQQALELSRQLYKQEPSEAHLDLLRQVTFERGQQLEEHKHTKDAVTLYANAADMGGPEQFRR